MARKRTVPPDPAPPEPDTAKPVTAKVVDMSVGDLLQLLGRTLPQSGPVQPHPTPALPAGIDGDAKTGDLTVGDLLQLLAAV